MGSALGTVPTWWCWRRKRKMEGGTPGVFLRRVAAVGEEEVLRHMGEGCSAARVVWHSGAPFRAVYSTEYAASSRGGVLRELDPASSGRGVWSSFSTASTAPRSESGGAAPLHVDQTGRNLGKGTVTMWLPVFAQLRQWPLTLAFWPEGPPPPATDAGRIEWGGAELVTRARMELGDYIVFEGERAYHAAAYLETESSDEGRTAVALDFECIVEQENSPGTAGREECG
eukprot:Hpha_TRINITY_DN24669_c0_g1::TRINITY_DN24669_c0_g1_i1::g.147458::m.147458